MSQQSTSGVRRLALVTGASSGIGLELARLFARNNYDLVIAAEDPAIDDVATELRSLGATVEAAQVDLATLEGVERLADRFGADRRAPDAIALSAGKGVVTLSMNVKAQAVAQMTPETVKAEHHRKSAEPGRDEEENGQEAPRRGSKTAKRAVANNRR